MNCWHCGTELIWGGDHDVLCRTPIYRHESNEEYVMETNLSCPKCNCLVLVFLPDTENGGVSPDGKVYE
jgi:hypothetical protein